MGKSGWVGAFAAVLLAGCAGAGGAGGGPGAAPANAPGAYGIPSDAASHGSAYSLLFGGKESGARQVDPPAQAVGPVPQAAPPSAQAAATQAANPAGQTAAQAAPPPDTIASEPVHPTAYGIRSDAASQGSVASYIKEHGDIYRYVTTGELPPGPPATPTAYGIPNDAGSQGSVASFIKEHGVLYRYFFGSKESETKPAGSSAAVAGDSSTPGNLSSTPAPPPR